VRGEADLVVALLKRDDLKKAIAEIKILSFSMYTVFLPANLRLLLRRRHHL
jgi:hypothetical protein